MAGKHHKPAGDRLEPWLNLGDAAAVVGVAPRTLRLAAERGEMDAAHPFPDGPWLFRRADVEGPPCQALAQRVRNGPKHPAAPNLAQRNLLSSVT